MAKTIQCDMLEKPILKIRLVCAIFILTTTHYLRNKFLLHTPDTSSIVSATDIDFQRGNLVSRLKPEVSIDCQSIFEGNNSEIKKVKDNKELVYI